MRTRNLAAFTSPSFAVDLHPPGTRVVDRKGFQGTVVMRFGGRYRIRFDARRDKAEYEGSVFCGDLRKVKEAAA